MPASARRVGAQHDHRAQDSLHGDRLDRIHAGSRGFRQRHSQLLRTQRRHWSARVRQYIYISRNEHIQRGF